MGWAGLFLLALALVAMMTTGWPTYAVLLGVSTLGALFGMGVGAFDGALLANLPARVVGLLEHDLLQALVLYALVGALLGHLALVDGVYGGLRKGLARRMPGAAPSLAGLGLGALLAPMNGSVGASLMTLSRTAGARWVDDGMPPARRAALVAVGSTLGVVVPPSLVLLLLGDAMMRAQTEALQLMPAGPATAGLRVVNTQDVLQAALLPGALLVAAWLLIAWWRAPRAVAQATPSALRLTRRERWTVIVVPLVIALLLGLVVAGHVRAVEAAATAGVLLLCWGAVSRQLTGAVLWQVLDDAMALTGALFALLIAATTFSLLLRGFGTDRLIAQGMQALAGHPAGAMAAVLVILLACAFVLDAFELIFLVVPIVMPPLLALQPDAAWVATLTLLVLQAGFLLPPFGYAVVLARAQTMPRPRLGAVASALAPYLLCQIAVGALVFAIPATTQWLRSAPATLPASTMTDDEIEQRMREMASPDAGDAPAAPPAAEEAK